MATIDTSGRPAYMYDEDTDTWYAVSGRVSTSANYVWTGAQQFTNNVLVDGALTVTSRINVFLNPAARSSAITSPQTGLLTFVRQDAGGNTINRLEFWNGSAWAPIANTSRWTKTAVGGETSISGNDDFSVPLTYAPGYERVYINGVLLARAEYTATNGTSITGLSALSANDIIEVL